MGTLRAIGLLRFILTFVKLYRFILMFVKV